MKQGVQLILERVQRHRVFPRLAAANGQNMPTTLSQASTPVAVARLERPRFAPVVTANTSRSTQNNPEQPTRIDPETRVISSNLSEDLPQTLQPQYVVQENDVQNFEPDFVEDSEPHFVEDFEPRFVQNSETEVIQDSEPEVTQNKELVLENNLRLEPENQFDQKLESLEPAAASTRETIVAISNQEPVLDILKPESKTEILAQQSENTVPLKARATLENPSITVNQNTKPSVTPKTFEATPNPRVIPVLEATKPQVQTVKDQSEIRAGQQLTPILKPQTTASVQTSQTSASIMGLEATQEPENLNQNNTESRIEQALNSETQNQQSTPDFAANTNQETPFLASQTNQLEILNPEPTILASFTDVLAPNKPNEIRVSVPDSLNQEQQNLPAVQAGRSLSRLESTLESLRQFHPDTNQAAIQSDSKPTTQISETRAAKTKTTQGKIEQTEISGMLPKSAERKTEAKTETSGVQEIQEANQVLETIPETRETQIQNSDLKEAIDAVLETFDPSELAAQVTPTETISDLTSALTQIENKIIANVQNENQLAVNNTRGIENQNTYNLETQTPESLIANTEVVQSIPVEATNPEALERAAYQRSVMLRAERAKRALAAKEDLERDPTLEIEQTLESPVQADQARQNQVPVSQPAEIQVPVEARVETNTIKDIQIPKPNEMTTPLTVLIQSKPQESNAVETSSNQTESLAENLSETTLSSETTILNSELPNSSQTETISPNEILASNSSPVESNGLQTRTLPENLDSNSSEARASTNLQNPNINSSAQQIQNSNALQTPNQDLPPSFIKAKSEGVSVYNPQRRIQRNTPAPRPKPKPEMNEAEKLFADMPEILASEIADKIRKMLGGNTQTNPEITRDTERLEARLPAPQAATNEDGSRITPNFLETQNPQVTRATKSEASDENTLPDINSSEVAIENVQSSTQTETRASETQSQPTLKENLQLSAVDEQGNKVHVFNPPNRRVVPPKAKVETEKNEAEKMFERMEVSQTPEQMFERLRQMLNPNATPQLEEQSSYDSEPTNTRLPAQLTTSQPNSLLPNLQPTDLPNLSNPAQSPTGNSSVQLGQNARRFLKPIVGIDPSEVKIYRDPQTERLTKAARADALTIGETILLSNETALESPETLGLIAHELTHVARNRQARFVPPVARGNTVLAASAQAGNEEGLALGVEAIARQAWTNLEANQTTTRQGIRYSSAEVGESTKSSSYGGLPAPQDLPGWFLRDGIPPQQATSEFARSESARQEFTQSEFTQSEFTQSEFAQSYSSTLETNYSPPPSPSNALASSIGAQAASQGRDVPTPPPAAGALPPSNTPKPEQAANRAAPDLDAMARQVYNILKRRLANEQKRM